MKQSYPSGSPTSARFLLGALCMCLAPSVVSCVSYRTERLEKLADTPTDWQPLPYHVAVIPIDAGEVTMLDDAKNGSGAPFAFGFKALADGSNSGEVGRDVLTQRMEGVLEANAFRKVTILPSPTAEEYEALQSARLLPLYWVTAAREAEADLLLDINSFTYPERPKSSAELLSFALYLAGPLELLFPDREYSFEGVSLEASLYDVDGLDAPRYTSRDRLMSTIQAAKAEGGGSDREALADAAIFQFEPIQGGAIQGTLRQFIVSPPNMKFRFGDRLDGGPASLSFWKSVLIPSAWLQNDSPTFSKKLTDHTSIALAQDLAKKIIKGEYAYIVGSTRAAEGFLFDAKNATLARSGDKSLPDILELTANIRRPLTDFRSPELRVMGSVYSIVMNDGEMATQPNLRQAILASAKEGRVWATIAPRSDPLSEFDETMTIYLPSPSQKGAIPSSVSPRAQQLSDLVPMDSVQLSLGEDLVSRGLRRSSWTFDLTPVVGKKQMAILMRDPIRFSSSTVAAPERGM